MAGHARSVFTTRLLRVIFCMFLAFLLCYYLDGMKCKREKHTTFCFGPAKECGEHEVWCEDLVENRALVKSASQCSNMGTATLLVHVIEAGPALTRSAVNNERSLAKVMLAAISARCSRSQNGDQLEVRNASALFDTPYTERILNDTNMEPIFHNLRQNSSILFSSDVVRFAVQSKESMVSVVTAAVPSEIDSFSLRKYFPNLEAALESVRKTSTGSNGDLGDNSGCNVFNLVVYIVLNVGQADRPASEVKDALLTMRKTLTRFLSRKKRYNKYLNSVWFVCIPTNGPSHFFDYKPPNAAVPIAGSAEVTKSFTRKLCSKNTLTERIQCETACSTYRTTSEASSKMSKALSTFFGTSLETTTRTIFFPYRECYYQMHKNESTVNQTFEDCTHLTKAGVVELVNCLLK